MSNEAPSADQMLDRWALPPELDEAGKEAIRVKARGRSLEAFGHMSDEWVADRVRMLVRDDLWHEPICQAARDRIMRLSLEVERLKAELAELRKCKHPRKHGTGLISSDSASFETWCSDCGEKMP